MLNIQRPKGAYAPAAAQLPVGFVFISVVSTNPATLLGYGTWSLFGAGRTLIGIDSGDPDFDTVEETVGAKTVASSAQTFTGNTLGTHQHAAITAGTPAGTVAAPTFTGTPSSVIVNHVHVQNEITGATGNFSGSPIDTSAGGTGGAPNQAASSISTANPTGGAESYTPTGTNSAPAFTGSALATHQHDAITAGTPAGTNTPGAATSVVQPGIVVYMFKRTA